MSSQQAAFHARRARALALRAVSLAAALCCATAPAQGAHTKRAYKAVAGVTTQGACSAPNVWDAAVGKCFSNTPASSVAPGDYLRWVLGIDSGSVTPPGSPVLVSDTLASGQTPAAGTLKAPTSTSNGWSAGALPTPGMATTVATWSATPPASGQLPFSFGADELWAYPKAQVPPAVVSVSATSTGDGFIAQQFVTPQGHRVLLAATHHVGAAFSTVKCLDLDAASFASNPFCHPGPFTAGGAGSPTVVGLGTPTSFQMVQYGSKVFVLGRNAANHAALGGVELASGTTAALTAVEISSLALADSAGANSAGYTENLVGSKLAGSRLYYLFATGSGATLQNHLGCWDLAAAAACSAGVLGAFPVTIDSGTSSHLAVAAGSGGYQLLELSASRFAFSSATGFYCVDDNGGAPRNCAGGTSLAAVSGSPATLNTGTLYPLASGGEVTGFCGGDQFGAAPLQCWSLAGALTATTLTPPTGTIQSDQGNVETPSAVVPGTSRILYRAPGVTGANTGPIGGATESFAFACLDTSSGLGCGFVPMGVATPSDHSYGGSFISDTCYATFTDDSKFELWSVGFTASSCPAGTCLTMTPGCSAGAGGDGSVRTVLAASDPAAQECGPASGSAVLSWGSVMLTDPPASAGGTVRVYSNTTSDKTSLIGETLLDTQAVGATTLHTPVSVPITPAYASNKSLKVQVVLSKVTGVADGAAVPVKVSYTTSDSSTPQVCYDATVGGSCPSGTLNSFSLSGGATAGPINATTGAGAALACAAATGSLATSVALTGVNGGAVPSGYLVHPGDQLVYTLTVTETGGVLPATTTLTETVPTSTTYSGSAEGWGAGCTAAGTSCTQPVTVSAGGTVTRTFTVTVGPLPDGAASVADTASSSAGSCGACTATTAAAPKLSLTKAGPATLPAGGTASFTVTLANQGGAVTSGTVAFTDTLPAGLAFASQTSGAPLGCGASGQVITCTGAAAIAAGGSLAVAYTVNVASFASGAVTNSAKVSAGGGDTRTPACDNAAPASGSGNQSSDGLCASRTGTVQTGTLSVSKSLTGVNAASVGSGYQIHPGDVLTYTIAVQNTGAGSASTTLTETVPASTSYSGSSEGWSTGCAAAGTSCTQAVTVAAGSTVRKTFTATVAASLPDGAVSISNTVASSSGACTGCTAAPVTAPKLSLAKAGPATLPAGGTASYTVTLANRGGSATSGTVAFTDTLPSGLTFASQTSGAPLVCGASGQLLTCSGAAVIAAGASLAVSYSVAVAAGASGALTNAAKLTAGGGDARTATCDNASPAAGSSTQSTDGLCASSSGAVQVGALSVGKTLATVNGGAVPTDYLVTPGDLLGYSITVRETSGAAAASTTVTEAVPDHTTYSGSGEGWSAGCAAAGTTCTRTVLAAAGETVAAAFTVRVDTDLPVATTTISNTVTLSAGTCAACTAATAVAPLAIDFRGGPSRYGCSSQAPGGPGALLLLLALARRRRSRTHSG